MAGLNRGLGFDVVIYRVKLSLYSISFSLNLSSLILPRNLNSGCNRASNNCGTVSPMFSSRIILPYLIIISNSYCIFSSPGLKVLNIVLSLSMQYFCMNDVAMYCGSMQRGILSVCFIIIAFSTLNESFGNLY